MLAPGASRLMRVALLLATIGLGGRAEVSAGSPADPAGMDSPAPATRSPLLRMGHGGAPVPVRLHADAGLEAVGALLVGDSLAWRPFPGIGPVTAVLADTVDIWIVHEFASLAEIGLARPEKWVAGIADPARRRIALRVGEDLQAVGGVRGVFRHELAHLILYEAAGGRTPRWLDEGYAQYASGAWSAADAWHLRFVFFRKGGSTLREVDLRFQLDPLEVRLGYLLAYTAVHELASLAGEPGLSALFGRLRKGDSFDAALRGVFGITEESFEQRWRRTLLDRYGWLYVLSRATVFWLAVAILVLAVTFRRRRQDRRRLDALREAEALEAAAPELS